jgi:hypothetical protein
MIDLSTETPVPLADAAKLIPPARSGKRTHLSTLLRWILTGATGPDGSRVRLEAVRLGNRWMTSRSALQRFVAALTPRLDAQPAEGQRCHSHRRRASERAASELERRGV